MAQENDAIFTEEEQGRVLYHLGYPQVNVGSFLAMGVLALTETMFVAVNALQHIPATRAGIIRDLLAKLDKLHIDIFGATDFLYAEQVAEIKPNLGITDALRVEYTFWAKALAESLGVTLNPFSTRFTGGRPQMVRRVNTGI